MVLYYHVLYTELFEAIGTTYGSGDGSTTFGIPNLMGRIPVGVCDYYGYANTIGKNGGEENHYLTINEIPSHNHYSLTLNAKGSERIAFGSSSTSTYVDYVTSNTGGNQVHNNLQPYIVLNYIIYTGVRSDT